MRLRVLIATAVFLSLSTAPAASQSTADVSTYADAKSGTQFGVPRWIPEKPSQAPMGIHWTSDDRRLAVSSTRFPPELTLQNLYQALTSRAGQRLTRDELTATALRLEGSNSNGTHFIVRAVQVATGTRVLTVTYVRGDTNLPAVARQIAASFTATSVTDAKPEASAGNRPAAAPPALAPKARQNAEAGAVDRARPVVVAQTQPASSSACQDVVSGVQAMASGLRVEVRQRETAAGQGVELAWSFRPQQRRQAMYLMVTLDRPARFSGHGYYILNPSARAPFGLKHGADKTRIVVPLYVSGGQTQRTIKIIPVLAGQLTLAAHVAAPSACGEQVVERLPATRIAVRPGQPRIEIVDDDLISEATDIILSPAGDRAIEVTAAATFRLVAWPNRAPIVSLAGSEPRFSPTGRYFTVRSGEVRDAIDGETVMTTSGTFSWDNKDSFIVESEAGRGNVTVYTPGAGALGSTSLGCRPCEGLGSSGNRIDLENNLVLAGTNFDGSTAAYSLTDRISYDDGMWSNGKDKQKFGSSVRFAQLVSQVAPLSFPKKWEFIEKPQFPYDKAGGTTAGAELQKLIAGHGFLPVLRHRPDDQRLAAGKANPGRLARSVVGVVPDFDASRRSRDERLRNFGIPDHPVVRLALVEDALGPSRSRPAPGQFRPYKHDARLAFSTDRDGSNAPADSSGQAKLWVPNATFWAAKVGNRMVSLVGGGDFGGSAGYSHAAVGVLDSRQPGVVKPIGSSIPFEEALNPGGGCSIKDCRHSSAISHERYLLIWSPRGIELVDLQTYKTSAFAPFRGHAIDRVSLSPDAHMLVQRNSDGTFAVHDVRLGASIAAPPGLDLEGVTRPETLPATLPQPVLFGRYADDEVVVWTASGHFDATYEGAAQVNLRFAGLTDLYSFDQFAALMHRPGLAGLLLQGAFKDQPIAYKVPPTIAGNIRAEGDQVSVSLRQTSGSPLSRLLVYQDGLRTEDVAAPANGGPLDVRIKRLTGVRWLSVVGIDADGLASRPLLSDIGPAPSKRNLKLLGVGVDTYSDGNLPKLAYARSDVDRVSEAVRTSRSQIYANVDVAKLFDAAATRQAVMSSLKSLLGASGPDTDVMLMFAGHGLKGSDGGYYLALTQSKFTDLKSTAISWNEIAGLLAGSRARVTIILDSCHSGEAGKGMFSTNDDVATGLLANAGGNVVILAGSKGREYSLESKETGGGMFSAAVSLALANGGQTTDSNRNGALEASEIFAAVRTYVITQSRGQQTPWIARNKMIGDFAWF